MINGTHIRLRPLRSEDWEMLEKWAVTRESLWGAYQRFRLDHIPLLRQAFQQNGLLNRQSGFLLIEKIDAQNLPVQKLLQSAGFQREGLLRRASYRMESGVICWYLAC